MGKTAIVGERAAGRPVRFPAGPARAADRGGPSRPRSPGTQMERAFEFFADLATAVAPRACDARMNRCYRDARPNAARGRRLSRNARRTGISDHWCDAASLPEHYARTVSRVRIPRRPDAVRAPFFPPHRPCTVWKRASTARLARAAAGGLSLQLSMSRFWRCATHPPGPRRPRRTMRRAAPEPGER